MRAGLNPFFIRAVIQSKRHGDSAWLDGLNPFFIRAVIQRHSPML